MSCGHCEDQLQKYRGTPQLTARDMGDDLEGDPVEKFARETFPDSTKDKGVVLKPASGHPNCERRP